MASFCEQVDRALKDAGLKIHGVSIGRKDDKSTWRVDFSDYRDGDEKTANAVIDSFDIEAAKAAHDAMFNPPQPVVQPGREMQVKFAQATDVTGEFTFDAGQK